MQTGGEATAAGEGGLMESCENEGVKGEALVSTRPGVPSGKRANFGTMEPL